MDGKSVLFKVVMRASRHEYVIYDDGSIEGFGDDVMMVANYCDTVVAERVARAVVQRENGTPSRVFPITMGLTADLVGVPHSSPEYEEIRDMAILTAPGEK